MRVDGLRACSLRSRTTPESQMLFRPRCWPGRIASSTPRSWCGRGPDKSASRTIRFRAPLLLSKNISQSAQNFPVCCSRIGWASAAMDICLRGGVRDEHTRQRSVRSEQRNLRQKDMPPGGLRRSWVLASLLARSQPAAGMLPRSRLARTQERRNKCLPNS